MRSVTVVVSVAAGGCVVEDDGVDSKTITPKPEKQARVVACHNRLYYTLTRTSLPNHASHIKDMKYALIRSVKIQNH